MKRQPFEQEEMMHLVHVIRSLYCHVVWRDLIAVSLVKFIALFCDQ